MRGKDELFSPLSYSGTQISGTQISTSNKKQKLLHLAQDSNVKIADKIFVEMTRQKHQKNTFE
jgi:hypothetical protein